VVSGGSQRCPDVPEGEDYIGRINFYRCQAGLEPVTVDANLQAGAAAHSCWMARNNVLQHHENEGTPGFSQAGSLAASQSDLGMDSGRTTKTGAVNNFFEAPFHAAWLLQHNLKRVAYADCQGGGANWYTLNVVAGLQGGPRPAPQPVFWPGQGSVARSRSGGTGETPNPGQMCGYGETTGLPIVVLLPRRPSRTPAAKVTNNGRVLTTCVIWSGNIPLDPSQGANAGMWRDSVSNNIDMLNEVFIVPREIYQPGTVQVQLDDLSWWFTVQ